VLGEEGPEVASRDLRRRPPQGIGVQAEAALAPLRQVRAQEPGDGAGQEQPAKNAPERFRVDRSSSGGRDRLRRRIGLLGGDAALLDRERGRITGGVHAVDTRHPPALVRRHEPGGIVGKAGKARPDQLRQGDDAVRGYLAVGDESQPARLE
jgi:hypothetical protein